MSDDLESVREAIRLRYAESDEPQEITAIPHISEGVDSGGPWVFAMWVNVAGEVGVFFERMTVAELLDEDPVPWLERERRREQAEKDARWEKALRAVEDGLPGHDVTAALRRLGGYVRQQLGEDQADWEAYSDWLEGKPTEDRERTTRHGDKDGLQRAVLLLATETGGQP